MSEKPYKLFEQQIERIHRLLENVDAEVKWNDRICDPDNPLQLRQVDISIRRKDRLTIVECRDHKSKQDVKWIEELYGRKVSLNADSIIGVSSSGYTENAIVKAKRLGVILRDFETLSDHEIQDWGEATKLTLFFYEFRDLEMCFFMDRIALDGAPIISDKKNNLIDQRDLLMKLAERYDLGKMQDRFAVFRAKLNGLRLNGVLAKSIVCTGKMRSRRYEASAPVVSIYSNAEDAEIAARVEKFGEGQSQVIHGDKVAAIVMDLSVVKIPERCIFAFPQISNEKGLRITRAEVIGSDNILKSKVVASIKIAQ